ncbi:MAG: hypothetical protein ACSHX3_11825 [Litorimonas sp.]
MADEELEWDEDDVTVGRGLYVFTALILISTTFGIAWSGYNNLALFGWPIVGGLVFVLLRVWKGMLGKMIDDVVKVVDLNGDNFDETRLQERSDSETGHHNWVAIGIGLIVYAVFITLFWYGMGRGVGWVVSLF